jgi:hypothetical protein
MKEDSDEADSPGRSDSAPAASEVHSSSPQKERYEGAVEVRLRTSTQGRNPASAGTDVGYRRIHAVPKPGRYRRIPVVPKPGTTATTGWLRKLAGLKRSKLTPSPTSQGPVCGDARLPLLPTFATWTTAAPSGVHRCEVCMDLARPRRVWLPLPRLGRRLLADGTPPQWTYRPPSLRFAVACSWAALGSLVVVVVLVAIGAAAWHPVVWNLEGLLFAFWPIAGLVLVGTLRFRMSVWPKGVTVVHLRRRSFSWDEIRRFDLKSTGEGGQQIVLVPRHGRAVSVAGFVTDTSPWRAASRLNELFGLEQSADLGGAVERRPFGPYTDEGCDAVREGGPIAGQTAAPPGTDDEVPEVIPADGATPSREQIGYLDAPVVSGELAGAVTIRPRLLWRMVACGAVLIILLFAVVKATALDSRLASLDNNFASTTGRVVHVRRWPVHFTALDVTFPAGDPPHQTKATVYTGLSHPPKPGMDIGISYDAMHPGTAEYDSLDRPYVDPRETVYTWLVFTALAALIASVIWLAKPASSKSRRREFALR